MAADAQRPSGDGQVKVTCPGCGKTQSITPLGYSGDDFCTQCDYPLFWAAYERPVDATDAAHPTVSVLPGVEGQAMERYVVCPLAACREPNPVTRRTCIRCGTPLPTATVPRPSGTTEPAVAPPT